ncbi:hypothetical protein [Agromyces larvae]|uniref:Uncharacterized protein n=1 Tax=Agromyces larvae TaxID=2929802 RepID=A0ABY4C115_9MICO|nr:hypothetical protein [Agromyces larvae]UOE45078.1 hypothetical protein MTO99_04670 [Agromyces larvae]
MHGHRVGAVAIGALIATVTGGCSAPTPPVAATSTSPPVSSPAGTEPSDPWGELPDPAAAVAVMPGQRGDCPIDPAGDDLIAFVVTTGDDRTAVRVTYPVFRVDGQRMVRRMTSPGPVVTVVIADCTGGEPSDLAGFRAATDDAVPLSCALFAGGELVAADRAASDAEASGARVECAASPSD